MTLMKVKTQTVITVNRFFFHIFEFVYFLGCQFGISEHCIVKGVCTSKENIRDINLELFCR